MYKALGKRFFDLTLSLLLTVLLLPIILLFFILASVDTASSGLFIQKRVGQYGKLFKIYKLKTIHPKTGTISNFGSFLRNNKIDELPQVINILFGDMSFVGPRPDLPGYYDVLNGDERRVLNIKPGLTSEASLKYKNEDEWLAEVNNPLEYNDEILFPDKVKMNLEYINLVSFLSDFRIIWKTLVSFFT